MAGSKRKLVIKDLLEDDEFLSAVNALVSKAVDAKIHEMKTLIEKQNGDIHDLQCSLEEAKYDVKQLRKELESSQNTIRRLMSDQNNQEQYSRRNCVRIYGVKESLKENTDDVVCRIANDHLAIDLDPKAIDRSHRVGKHRELLKPNGLVPPRLIIVKLTSYRYQQMLIAKRRALKNTGIGIQEDLTDLNNKLLFGARHHPKVEAAWSMDGRVFVIPRSSTRRQNQNPKIIRCREDLDSL